MAMVSGGSSTLNPNAPLFIPAALRQVEDFSPEWWELVTTSTWFHDYWLSQHQEDDGFYGNGDDDNDIANLLPDTIDLFADEEDFSNMDAYFDEFIRSSETAESDKFAFSAFKGIENGSAVDAEALIRSLSLSRSGKERGAKGQLESPKYNSGKPVKGVSPKCSPRRIQQPR